MGACFGSQSLPMGTNLVTWYADAIEEALYEYGHDPYNGTISTTEGLNNVDHLFNSDEEAEDWLVEHCHKWGEVQVVKVGTRSEFHYLAGWWASE